MKRWILRAFCLMLCTILLVSVLAIPASAKVDLSRKYPLDATSPLRDLYIGFFGDSICEGMVEMNTDYADVRAWAGRIAAVNGCQFDNHGRSGASVSNCRGANTIMTQLENARRAGKKYDMIVLHGGVNDAWDDIAVGEISEGYPPSYSYDPSTFAPGLEQIISYVEEYFPDAVVCYIINFKFLNASMGISLMDMDRYVDATIEICEKWDVPYLDLYHNEELVDALHPYTTSSSGKKNYQSTYLYDFVHPSTLGFDLIYPYVNEFLIELIDPDYIEDKEDDVPAEPNEPNIPDEPADPEDPNEPNPPEDSDQTDSPDVPDDSNDEKNDTPPAAQEKGGCSASLGWLTMAFCLMACGVACFVGKKKDE